MRIDIITLFPEMFAPLEHSITKRAVEKELAQVNIIELWDFTNRKHGETDDRIYGGGVGMLMKPEPLFEAVEKLKSDSGAQKVRVVMTSPAGRVFDQRAAEDLATAEQVIFLCGHYEGIDHRVEQALCTDVYSIGDFVLTGGEMPAMIMADSVIRLLPGVLGHDESAQEESFGDGLLEYPHYTRPPEFRGMAVPAVLMEGNHKDIVTWRRQQALERTLERRPEQLAKACLSEADCAYLAKLKADKKPFRLWISLLHYPVYNKKHEVINTSTTNLDIHDIARAAATYDLGGYFLVQPQQGQKELINTLVRHWQKGFGANYNPDRNRALANIHVVDSLAEAVAMIEQQTGALPRLIATSAQGSAEMVGYRQMREQMSAQGGDYLLVLGTGYGLTAEIMEQCDYVLRPIYGVGDYNHLSVRSAASIMLDRLVGEKD